MYILVFIRVKRVPGWYKTSIYETITMWSMDKLCICSRVDQPWSLNPFFKYFLMRSVHIGDKYYVFMHIYKMNMKMDADSVDWKTYATEDIAYW